MRKSLVLWFLYRTIPGRMILTLLVRPNVSEFIGQYLSSRASRWIVPYYIRKHGIDMDDIEIPSGGFSSFNEFFTRKRRTGCFDVNHKHLISPCDGFLSFTRITEDTVLSIKNTRFTLEDMLKDSELAGQFKKGTALIFRLTPANYHRYCYVANGKIILNRKIQGILHCVRPIALRSVPVFAQNSREYQVLGTERFGTVLQMEVGALLVGKINNDVYALESGYAQRGEEKGYFEFGGSTIIILLQKNTICFNENLYKKQSSNGEIPVCMGEFVAEAREEGEPDNKW